MPKKKYSPVSVRLPSEVLEALNRRCERVEMSKSSFIEQAIRNALALGEEVNLDAEPLPTDKAIADLTARVAALEEALACGANNAPTKATKPVEEAEPDDDGLLDAEAALKLAKARGYKPKADDKKAQLTAFRQAFADFAKKQTSTNIGELYSLERVKLGRHYKYKDISK